MKWFRLYDEIIDDPKILRLSPESRWRYIECLCIANRQRQSSFMTASRQFHDSSRANQNQFARTGMLPAIAVIAKHMRLAPSRARSIIARLIQAGLINEDPETEALTIHGWDTRQFESDNATARWSKSKERRANVGANVGANGSPTAAPTDQIQIQIQNQKKDYLATSPTPGSSHADASARATPDKPVHAVRPALRGTSEKPVELDAEAEAKLIAKANESRNRQLTARAKSTKHSK